MSKSATIRARMDPDLKEEAEAILQELGISTTQAITLFYQQIRINRSIPFDIRLPEKEIKKTNGVPVQPVSIPFPIDKNRSIMEENVAAYQALHAELVKDYLGLYVAISDGKLVDQDSDPVALLDRVRKNYPNQIVLRQKVDLAPEQELHGRHPRFESLS